MTYFVIDVESVGLHGEGYAVGGGLYLDNGACLWGFRLACPINKCAGSDDDRQWVKDNIPLLEVTHSSPKAMRNEFWKLWMKAKKDGAIMAADCGWPVEAKFLLDCIKDDPSRKFDGPYPFVDVGSVLLANGLDPLKNYDRTPSELPKHDPYADARQSARLLTENLK